ncbi:MAG: ABC transporter ATP-binding protein [Butyrivibrio sp.]
MGYILSTENLTKEYHHFKAVDSVCLHINEGDIYGFIGRNGAGKTTTLKMICGLASPTSGTFSLFGEPYEVLAKNRVFAKVGSLIEEPGIYSDMSAFDNVYLKCICAGIKDKGYAMDLLRLVDLDRTGNKKTKGFSLGMKQRLGIALAMVGDPKLLILDEPINGLDPQGIMEIRETILKLNTEKKTTFIISSHILGELSKIATRYGIIDKGRLIKEFSAEELSMGAEDLEKFYFELTGGAVNAELN